MEFPQDEHIMTASGRQETEEDIMTCFYRKYFDIMIHLIHLSSKASLEYNFIILREIKTTIYNFFSTNL